MIIITIKSDSNYTGGIGFIGFIPVFNILMAIFAIFEACRESEELSKEYP